VEKSSLKWLGAPLGYKHESNGRGGAGSRSLNMVFARTAMAFGKLEGWRVVVAPRIYTYISDLSDNRDIKHYLGYGELRLIIGRNDGLELMLNGHLGSDWHRPTVEANFTYPLRWKFGDFASYLLVQYFHGYGESLLYYNQETESIRAGFSFVR
jgi:outer membrane phospholipase A